MGIPYFAPSARKDLEDLSEFIARDKPVAALEFVERLKLQCQSLATNPAMGFTRDDLAVNLRVWPVGNWLIFYRPAGIDIEVVRIFHGARDLPGLFE